jgi:hypothetical protein
VGGVRQTEMHTAEPSVPQPSASEAEVAIGKLKTYKSPSVDHISAEMIHTGWETLGSEIPKLKELLWNCLTSGKSQLNLFTKRVIKLTVVNIDAYHCSQLHTKFYPTFLSLGQLHMQMKLLGIITVDFDITDQ